MRTMPALLAMFALAACGRSEKDAPAQPAEPVRNERSVSSDLPVGVKPSKSVLEMRRIAGVWRSSPGVLTTSPGNVVQLEIAFDDTFSMTLWGKDAKSGGEAVFARQAGRIGRTAAGIAGSSPGVRQSPLSPVSTWSASLDADGMMVLVPSGTNTKITLRKTAS